MTDDIEAEWAPRSAFAEVAEALGLTTTEVFSVMPFENGDVSVIYTPNVAVEKIDAMTYLSLMRRDADGIFQHVREPVEVPGFLEKVVGGLDEYMERERKHGNG